MDKKSLFIGLKALSASSFPKSCACCGRTFESAEAFLVETQAPPSSNTFLRAARDVDGSTLLEVFRNCPCGSTLMDEFQDRRESSTRGNLRRLLFKQLLESLRDDYGFTEQVARAELLKVVLGESSEQLAKLFPQVEELIETATEESSTAGEESGD